MDAEIIESCGTRFVVDRRESLEQLRSNGQPNFADLLNRRGFVGLVFAHKPLGANSYLLYQNKRGGYEVVYPRA